MTARLIYILGAGRSGSTLLERLLASAPGVVGVGELHALWRQPLDSLTCSCGAPGPECRFWRAVRAEARIGADGLAELAALERGAVRHWRLILGGGGRDLARYAAIQRRLFAAIRDVTGAATVVDSSKAAPRAWALADFEDAAFLHLRRDPREVIAAWRRRKNDPSLPGAMRRPPALAAAADWLRTELSAARLAARRPVEKLRYEEFVAGPRAALASQSKLPQAIAWTGPRRFTPDPDYHALNGNPDRFSRGEILIHPPERPARPIPENRAAAALGAALNRIAP